MPHLSGPAGGMLLSGFAGGLPGPDGRLDGGRCDGGREGAGGGRDAGGRDGGRDGARGGAGPSSTIATVGKPARTSEAGPRPQPDGDLPQDR